MEQSTSTLEMTIGELRHAINEIATNLWIGRLKEKYGERTNEAA